MKTIEDQLNKLAVWLLPYLNIPCLNIDRTGQKVANPSDCAHCNALGAIASIHALDWELVTDIGDDPQQLVTRGYGYDSLEVHVNGDGTASASAWINIPATYSDPSDVDCADEAEFGDRPPNLAFAAALRWAYEEDRQAAENNRRYEEDLADYYASIAEPTSYPLKGSKGKK